MTTPVAAASGRSDESGRDRVVFLLDVDDTLLDNDAVERDLRAHLTEAHGQEGQARYWAIFEELRHELGYADYLGTLQRYRMENLRDRKLLATSLFLMHYPFAERLYPGTLDAIAHLKTMGETVILSDGDVVFQPRKIEESGLWKAVNGNVLIYIHKEEMLDDVAARYPAGHYVMVDDKVRLLTAMKAIWGDRLTTVFPRQGHYALDAQAVAQYPPPDLTVKHIADLTACDLTTFRPAAPPPAL